MYGSLTGASTPRTKNSRPRFRQLAVPSREALLASTSTHAGGLRRGTSLLEIRGKAVEVPSGPSHSAPGRAPGQRPFGPVGSPVKASFLPASGPGGYYHQGTWFPHHSARIGRTDCHSALNSRVPSGDIRPSRDGSPGARSQRGPGPVSLPCHLAPSSEIKKRADLRKDSLSGPSHPGISFHTREPSSPVQEVERKISLKQLVVRPTGEGDDMAAGFPMQSGDARRHPLGNHRSGRLENQRPMSGQLCRNGPQCRKYQEGRSKPYPFQLVLCTPMLKVRQVPATTIMTSALCNPTGSPCQCSLSHPSSSYERRAEKCSPKPKSLNVESPAFTPNFTPIPAKAQPAKNLGLSPKAAGAAAFTPRGSGR